MSFIKEEFRRRKPLFYPPFSELILINCSSPLEAVARKSAEQLRKKLMENLTVTGELEADLLGPSPAPIFKIKDRFRYHLIFKGINLQKYTEIIRKTVWHFSKETGRDLRVTVDFDPMMML